jgi:hypothetical protein
LRASVLDGQRVRANGRAEGHSLSGFRDRNPAVRIAECVYIIRPEASHRAFSEIRDLVRNATKEGGRSLAFRFRLDHGRYRRHRFGGDPALRPLPRAQDFPSHPLSVMASSDWVTLPSKPEICRAISGRLTGAVSDDGVASSLINPPLN